MGKEMLVVTFLMSVWASSSEMGGCEGETGAHSCCERARAVMVGMRILCSVLLYPSTFSPKELSSSAGKGSRAPKSPRNSFTSMARVTRSEGDDDAPRPRARRDVGARGGHAMGRATGSTRLRLRLPVMAMYACALTLSCVMVVVGWVGKLEWIKWKWFCLWLVSGKERRMLCGVVVNSNILCYPVVEGTLI